MIEADTIVYRSAKACPPEPAEYLTAATRRGHPVGRTPEQRLASTELSVYVSLELARINGARNARRISTLLVRYRIPAGTDFSLKHLCGDEGHYTLRGDDLSSLADFLDRDWKEDLKELPTEGR
jgi:hypothetical protein